MLTGIWKMSDTNQIILDQYNNEFEFEPKDAQWNTVNDGAKK